jgi:hypothetical protein
VTAFAPNGREEELLSENGAYSGIRPMRGGPGQWYLGIKAGGSWSVRIEAAPVDESVAQVVTGVGSYVSGLFTPPASGPVPYAIEHRGGGQLTLRVYCVGGSDTVEKTNRVIHGDTIVTFGKGPCMWDVTTYGRWSIKRKQ